MTFIGKLDEHLREHNYTKADFSKYSGIPYTTICGWYSRNVGQMRKDTIDKLLKYFRCSYEELFLDDIDGIFEYKLSAYEKEILDIARKIEDKKEQIKLIGKLELIVENK